MSDVLAARPTAIGTTNVPKRTRSDFFMRQTPWFNLGPGSSIPWGMSKALPSRADVLKLLQKEDRAIHAREIAQRLDVDDAKYQGFLRLLDNLVFDGVLQARDGHKFKTVSRGRGFGRDKEEPRSARGGRGGGDEDE